MDTILYIYHKDDKIKCLDLGNAAHDHAELVDAGWYQPLSESAKAVAPDFVLLPKSDRVVYHREFAKVKSMSMIGQHGGMSKAEWEVPLLVF